MATPAATSAIVPAPFAGGELLFIGGTDWQMIGRSAPKGKGKDQMDDEERAGLFPNLTVPHRMKNLQDIKIMFVSAGPAAVHCLAGDSEGRLYSWGRNEKGQLGHGDQVNRNMPKIVQGLEGKFIVGAAAGRFHSVAITKDGESYAFGSNQAGQLGIGSIKKSAVKGAEDLQLSPVKCVLSGATAVSCGVDFTIWIANGKAMGAGSPQYGQLGDGTDHAYNAKDSSICMVFDPQPTPKPVKGPLAEKTVARIVCGHTHSIAVDTEGSAYTWGNGGYGRLGHKVQQDEHSTKKVEGFTGRISVPADAIVAAGGTSSFTTTAPTGQMYSWGKLKTNGDNQMYPQPLMDLSGWNVRSMACGPAHFAVAADTSVITWGAATNGELGYGPTGKKSSANAAKCDSLEGFRVHAVAAGVGFTLVLTSAEDKERVAKLPVFESVAPEEEAVAEEEAAVKGAKGKRKAEASKPAAKAKKTK